MVRRRGRTAWIAALWLCCQSLALAVPIAANVIVESSDVCTCPGGVPGAQCPMHHHAFGTMPRPDGPAVRNACAQPDATFLSLASGLGVMPHIVSVSLDRAESFVPPISTSPLLRSDIPDAPPPRA